MSFDFTEWSRPDAPNEDVPVTVAEIDPDAANIIHDIGITASAYVLGDLPKLSSGIALDLGLRSLQPEKGARSSLILALTVPEAMALAIGTLLNVSEIFADAESQAGLARSLQTYTRGLEQATGVELNCIFDMFFDAATDGDRDRETMRPYLDHETSGAVARTRLSPQPPQSGNPVPHLTTLNYPAKRPNEPASGRCMIWAKRTS